MAKTNYSYEKRQKELAKKKKQEEKRQRKIAPQGEQPENGQSRPARRRSIGQLISGIASNQGVCMHAPLG